MAAMPMAKRPLLPVALALMCGIMVQHWLAHDYKLVWLCAMALLATATGLFFLLHRPWGRRAALVSVLLLTVSVGALIGANTDPRHDGRHWAQGCGRLVWMEVRLSATPQPRERSWRVPAEVLTVDGRSRRGEITLYLKKDSVAESLRYGDRLLMHAHPDAERRNVYVTSDHYLLTSRDNTSLRARCENLRMRLLRRMQRGPLENGGVAEALALGWRADIGGVTQARYRDAGIAHLLAVSGLHVGLLAGIVGALFFWTGRERRGRMIRGGLQLLAIWGFVLLTGMAPSTLRAALMFSLFIVSDVLARRTDKLNLLAAVALVMLLVKPMLLFDVGWQLSFSAVGGILLAMPAIRAVRYKWLQAVAVSTAATVATLPTVMATFHRLPLYFLIANVVIVPFAGVLLGLSLLYMTLPCGLTAWPLGEMLCATEWLTAWVQSLPGAVVEGIHASTPALLGVGTLVMAVLLLPQLFIKGNRN